MLATFYAFGPALGARFVNWDDPPNLLQNYSIRGLSREHLEWMFTTNWMGPYQPLAWLSLGVDFALWGMNSAAGAPEAPHYHQTNVLIHALAAVALYFVALELFWIVRPATKLGAPTSTRFAAFVAAGFFALHPLRAESVAWVTERRDVLSGLFLLLAAWAYLRFAPRAREVRVSIASRAIAVVAAITAALLAFASIDLSSTSNLALREHGALGLVAAFAALALSIAATIRAARFDGARASWRWFALCALGFLAALGSKGLAMTLPLAFLVLDVWPLARTDVEIGVAKGATRTRRAVAFADLALEKAPLFALTAVFAVLAMWGQASIPGTLASWTDHTFGERVLQCFYGLAFYPLKTVAPFGLAPIYGLPDDVLISDPRFYSAVLGVAAVYGALVHYRSRVPALIAASLCFAISVAPVLGMTQAGPQLVADRYSYLSCIPFALVVGGGVLIGALGSWRAPATAIAFLVLVALSFATRAQCEYWTDSEKLWQRGLATEPENALNYLNLAQARIEESESAKDSEQKKALLTSAHELVDQALARKRHPLLLATLAKIEQGLWLLDPRSKEHHEKLAMTAMQDAFDLAKSQGTLTPEYHLNLGATLYGVGKEAEGIAELEIYLRDRPESAIAHSKLGYAYLHARRYADAVREYQLALALEPLDVDAWGNLGQSFENVGDKERAIESYRRVLAIQPSHQAATFRLRALTGAPH